MIRKASFSVEISQRHSTAHNDRTEPPKYLIGLEENTQNYYVKLNGYINDTQFVQKMAQRYHQVFGQKMQQKQKDSMIKEAVISLKKHHGEKDILTLFKKLEEIFGGHIPLEVAIHRDEGHFVKDGISYYPNKHILKKEGGWFTISDDQNYNYADEETHFLSNFFDNPVDISEFIPVYNYHAHVKFTMINMMGIVPSFEKDIDKQVKITEKDKVRTAKMTKRMMQSRLKIVADHLNMRYAPNPKTSRIKKSIAHAKEDHESRRQLEIAKAEYKKEIEDLQSLLNGAKEGLKDKNLTIKLLESKISVLEENNELLDDSLKDEMIRHVDFIEKKDKYIKKLKEHLHSTISDNESTHNELMILKPKLNNLQKKINKQDKDIKALKNLSFIKNEDGEFETYKKDDGQSYYKTYKNENEKAIIFFKKVSSFLDFSNNLEDANQEIDELIKKKKIKEYKPAPTPYDDYSSGGMFL